jgi:surface polysaccharide O-acyltransferase-like enzyme
VTATAPPRLAASDVLRVLALVAVVCIHAAPWAPAAQREFTQIGLVSRFSVPVFMVLTGTLLAYRYAQRPTGSDFVRRRVSRSILPWLVWVPVFLAFDIELIHSVPPTQSGVLGWLQLGGGHLWYLVLIPQLYLLFLVWPRHHALALVLPALLLQTLLSALRLFGPLPGGALQHVVLDNGFLIFIFWIGYFAAGVALGRALLPEGRLPHRAGLAALAVVAVIAGGALQLWTDYTGAPYGDFVHGTGAFLNPVLPPLVLGAVLLIFAVTGRRLSGRAGGVVRWLSDHSLGIYIVHPIPLYYLGLWLRDWFVHGTPFSYIPFALLVLGALAAGAVVTRLIAATPLAVTVGMRRRPLPRPI